jgi:hypothetical protein
MKNPGFKVRLIRLFVIGSIGMAVNAIAEPPETGAPRSRTRPQIIYHLPPAPNYAAALHAQAKRQTNDLPVESEMPTSLQMSRGNANAAPPQPSPTPSFSEPRVKPKLKANRSQVHPRSFARPPGHGNPHGNKSHKK